MKQTEQDDHVMVASLADEDTVMVPFYHEELSILLHSLDMLIQKLQATHDFPEESEYKRILKNIQYAQYLVSPVNKVDEKRLKVSP